MKKCLIVIMVASFAVGGIFGCAISKSAAPQISEVQKILDEAWQNGAGVKASAEYYKAKSYLCVAQAEEAEYDFAAANRYAATALEAAKKALEKSK